MDEIEFDEEDPTLFRQVRRMVKAVLTAARRKKLKAKSFALPGRRYPIQDKAHARAALAYARFASPAEQARIRRAVQARYGYGKSKRRPMAKSQVEPAFRMTAADVVSLALCRRGKNGMRTMLKSGEIAALVKSDAVGKTGELYFVAYAPSRVDVDGWVADQNLVKAMSRDFMRHGAALDIEHDGETLDPEQAYVAETFIVQKSDQRFQNWTTWDGRPAGDLTGAWAGVIQIDDPELRAACAAGEIDGVSVFGSAAVEPLRKSSAASEEMTPAEIVALVKSTVAEALKPEQKPEAPAPASPDAPKFEGDPSSSADLRKYKQALQKHELAKSLAAGKLTPAELDKQIIALEKAAEAEPTDEEIGAVESDDDEKRELKRKLFKAQRGSNAPASLPESANVELMKSAQESGKRIAAIHNESRGASFRLVGGK